MYRLPAWFAASLLVLAATGGCRDESPTTTAIMALLDDRGVRTADPRCRPAGRPDLRAGLRRPRRCFARYDEGTAFWHRDQRGLVLSGTRVWQIPAGDRARWLRLHDSLTDRVGRIARGLPACAARPATDSADGVTAWRTWGYALAVRAAPHRPDGPRWHELRLEVARQDTLCARAATLSSDSSE